MVIFFLALIISLGTVISSVTVGYGLFQVVLPFSAEMLGL